MRFLLDPDHSEIIDAFDEYRERLGPKDNLLIYYAGHDGGDFLFVRTK